MWARAECSRHQRPAQGGLIEHGVPGPGPPASRAWASPAPPTQGCTTGGRAELGGWARGPSVHRVDISRGRSLATAATSPPWARDWATLIPWTCWPGVARRQVRGGRAGGLWPGTCPLSPPQEHVGEGRRAAVRPEDTETQAQESNSGASLVVQWLRICLPMQGTRVRALVREDPTCRGATKPVHHNY